MDKANEEEFNQQEAAPNDANYGNVQPQVAEEKPEEAKGPLVQESEEASALLAAM